MTTSQRKEVSSVSSAAALARGEATGPSADDTLRRKTGRLALDRYPVGTARSKDKLASR